MPDISRVLMRVVCRLYIAVSALLQYNVSDGREVAIASKLFAQPEGKLNALPVRLLNYKSFQVKVKG